MDEEINYFKLVPYLRLLQWSLLGEEEKQAFFNCNLTDNFLELLNKVDKNNTECDYNKLEMLKYMDTITDGYDLNSTAFSKTKNPNYIFHMFISLRDAPQKYVEYNDESLQHFFRVIYRMCRCNTEFLDTWMTHNNFFWSLRYMLVETPSYFRIGPVLEETIDLCIARDQGFKKILTDRIVEYGIPKISSNYATILKLIQKFIGEKVDQVHFVEIHGLTHLCNAFEISQIWNALTFTPLLRTILLAVTWFNSSNTQEHIDIKTKALESVSPYMKSKLISILETTDSEDIKELCNKLTVYFN